MTRVLTPELVERLESMLSGYSTGAKTAVELGSEIGCHPATINSFLSVVRKAGAVIHRRRMRGKELLKLQAELEELRAFKAARCREDDAKTRPPQSSA